ncbi:6362_t:CDS:2, partial [Cetraspora pellucida]
LSNLVVCNLDNYFNYASDESNSNTTNKDYDFDEADTDIYFQESESELGSNKDTSIDEKFEKIVQILEDDIELNKIIIQKPSKDVYDECTLFKHALSEDIDHVNKDIDKQLADHILDYQTIRKIYKEDVQIAKNCDQSLFKLPHNIQQPEKWYYLLLLKVYQFSLVNEGIDKHWHIIYIEDKASKEANEITLMVHLFFTSKA